MPPILSDPAPNGATSKGITLLVYLMTKWLGEPTRSRPDGHAEWPCPNCGRPTFSTRPHVEGMKDSFGCFSKSCDFWGDELDVIWHMHPEMSYPRRLDKLEQYKGELATSPPPPGRKEMNGAAGHGRRPPVLRGHPSSRPGGRGDISPSDLYESLSPEERRALAGMALIRSARGVSLSELAARAGGELDTLCDYAADMALAVSP